jgi:toxin HigB-1
VGITFADKGTEDIFDGRRSKLARKVCPSKLVDRARSKLFLLDDAESLDDLRVPPGNRLEALRGDREGQHSIRINNQYRICFVWSVWGPKNVEIVDYHS